MTVDEKLAALKAAISPDIEADEVLSSLLDEAEALVLNRMYPFGYPDQSSVPLRYEYIQIGVAVEIYSKRGAEGQIAHNENGINRTWAADSMLLKKIVPMCGSVIKNA